MSITLDRLYGLYGLDRLNMRLYSLMDKTTVFGTVDGGSIPSGGTYQKTYQFRYVFYIFTPPNIQIFLPYFHQPPLRSQTFL